MTIFICPIKFIPAVCTSLFSLCTLKQSVFVFINIHVNYESVYMVEYHVQIYHRKLFRPNLNQLYLELESNYFFWKTRLIGFRLIFGGIPNWNTDNNEIGIKKNVKYKVFHRMLINIAISWYCWVKKFMRFEVFLPKIMILFLPQRLLNFERVIAKARVFLIILFWQQLSITNQHMFKLIRSLCLSPRMFAQLSAIQ